MLGKYFIIELNSLYALLAGSNNSKGLKDFNEDYKSLEFKELSKKIRLLEGKHKFKVKEYWEILMNHLDIVLTKYYPEEKKLYFLMRQNDIEVFTAVSDKAGYIPFDEMEM